MLVRSQGNSIESCLEDGWTSRSFRKRLFVALSAAPGKTFLFLAILDLMKQNLKLDEWNIVIEPYSPVSVKKTLEFLRRLRPVASEGTYKPIRSDVACSNKLSICSDIA